MRHRLFAHAVVVGVILALAATARAGDETCERYTPVPPHEPTGIKNCVIYGEGIASRYDGPSVARNDCVWPWDACTPIQITSIETGRSIIVTPQMYGDLYTGTADERIVDLNRQAVEELGLRWEDGLYPVSVAPITAVAPPIDKSGEGGLGTVSFLPRLLPDTAMEIDSGEQANGYNRDAFSRVGIAPSERNRIHSDSPSASAAIPAWRRGRSVHRGIDR